MRIFGRAYYGIRWLISVGCGLLRFLLKNPGALLPTCKWVFLNLHVLPRRLWHKTHLNENRKRLKEELAECKALYEELKCCPQDALRWLEENAVLHSIRGWALVYFLLRIEKCRSVVETGVAEGVSTSYILQALVDNGGGLLNSVDLPNQFYLTTKNKLHVEFNPVQEEPGCLIPPELRGQWKLTLGKSSDILPKLLADSLKIDLFLHDSEHTYETMMFEYEYAWQHIRPGGYLVSDDVTWNDAFNSFPQRKGVKATIIGGRGFVQKPHSCLWSPSEC